MLTQPTHLAPQHSRAAALLDRFRTVRAATMHFCSPLTPEDMMVQSCAEASPVKWHLAHTTWFFETFVLSEFVAGYKPFDPNFHWLFNSYYRSLGEMPEKKLRASFSRPPLDQILAYRRHVDAAIARLLTCIPQDESQRRILLGLEHEQQHLELAATDIKHAFFTNPLHPAYSPAAHLHSGQPARPDQSSTIAPPLDWLSFTPGSPLRPGIVEIGLTPDPNDLDAFAFDNETPRHAVYLAPFQLASRAVTCSEYLAFIEDDGYSRPELWLSEGWDTLRAEGWQAPLYWTRDSATPSGWKLFTLHGFRSLGELSETPVCHLSFFEADAFARWSGHRLPTEFEWEYVAAQLPTPSEAQLPTSSEAQHPASSEAQHPASSEARLPASSEAQHPVSSEARHPASSEARHPASSEARHPASSEARHPASSGVAAGFSPRNNPSPKEGFSPGSTVEAPNMLESGTLHPQPAKNPSAPEPALSLSKGPAFGTRDLPQQLFGDVWEWTQSPYTGYPGYKPLPGALGEYNGKFMSSQIVLRGGSCVTPESHIRATYRNFFSPATRWQFSGLRLARDGA